MRTAILFACLAAALAASPALAGNGQEKKAQPVPIAPGLVEGPMRTTPGTPVPAGAAAAPDGGMSTAGDCGACLTSCWSAVARAGSADWSGHVYIFQHLSWCGNGARITSASAWQSFEQVGWYKINGTAGPYWVGGCVGCANATIFGAVYWDWSSPLINIHSAGTSNLSSTMWAYGAVTF